MTLDEHLGKGYTAYVHGKTGPWTRALFADELKNDANLMKAARTKLAECDAVISAGRQCSITVTQARILRDGIRTATAEPLTP